MKRKVPHMKYNFTKVLAVSAVAASLALGVSACADTPNDASISASPSITFSPSVSPSPSVPPSPSVSPSPSATPQAEDTKEPDPAPKETKEAAPAETKAPEPDPIKTVDVQDVTKYTTSGLNVRSGPGTSYPVISSLASGSKVTVTAINENGSWSVIGDGKWVSSSYLTTKAPSSGGSGGSGGSSGGGSSTSYTAFCSGGTNSTYSISSGDIKQLLSAANAERARLGYGALSWSGSLASAAQAWSETMVAEDNMYHNPNRPGGENVGYTMNSGGLSQGSALNILHKAWMGSQGHCENLMNPSYTQFGAGIASNADGAKWYSTENFK